jgi:hypothetical protein
MFKNRERSLKTKNQFKNIVVVAKNVVASKRKRDKSRKVRIAEKENSNENYVLFSKNEFFENDDII